MRALPGLIAAAAVMSGSVIVSARDSAAQLSAAALEAIAQVENEIDRIEADAIDRQPSASPMGGS